MCSGGQWCHCFLLSARLKTLLLSIQRLLERPLWVTTYSEVSGSQNIRISLGITWRHTAWMTGWRSGHMAVGEAVPAPDPPHLTRLLCEEVNLPRHRVHHNCWNFRHQGGNGEMVFARVFWHPLKSYQVGNFLVVVPEDSLPWVNIFKATKWALQRMRKAKQRSVSYLRFKSLFLDQCLVLSKQWYPSNKSVRTFL